MTDTIQTAVVGVTGYAGAELARLLLRHPRLKGKPPIFAGRVDAQDAARGGIPLSEIHPHLADCHGNGFLRQQPFSWDLMTDLDVDVLFLATPHEQSREWVPEALARGIRVIDLSGAWRLVETENRAVYAFDDKDAKVAAETQEQAVYGLPELHRKQIAGARLIANPGCYATSIILPLRPLVAAGLIDLSHGIVADAKSGVSGAGKAPTAKTHFIAAADNLSAYGAFTASMQARSHSRRICCPFRAAFCRRSMCTLTSRRPKTAWRMFIASSLPAVRWFVCTTKRSRRFSTRSIPATPTSASNFRPTASAQ
jgi:N-acetyl-gamma-glutamyl-phosphate reductase